MKKSNMMPSVALAALMVGTPSAIHGVVRNDVSATDALLADVKAEVTRIGSDVNKVAEQALADAKASGDTSAEVKASADKLLTQFHTLSAAQSKLEGTMEALETRNTDLEQLVAEGGSPGNSSRQSVGQILANDDKVAAYVAAGLSGNLSLNVNQAITSIDGSGGGLIWDDQDKSVIGIQRRQVRIRQLLNVTTTESDVVTFARQVLRTNNAGMTAEGAPAPVSEFGWDKDSTNVKKVTHVTHVSDEAIADAGQLAGLVDGELRYGLDVEEDLQLLSGDGLGDNLSGMMTNAPAFVAAAGLPNTTRIDRLRLALLQVALQSYAATGVTLHPTDWAAIDLLKDTTGRYIFGNENGVSSPSLWGLDVVATLAHAVNEFLVGDFFMAGTVYDRQQTEVLISSEHGTNFVDGMKTMKGTKRLAFADKRPLALVTGNFIFA